MYSRTEMLGFGDGPTGRGWVRGWVISVESKVQWSLELSAHGSRNAADDVAAVDGATFPCVSSDHGGLNSDQVSATIRACDCDCFVQVSEEALNADSFVVCTRSRVETDAKDFADVGEDATKGATSVDDDKAAHYLRHSHPRGVGLGMSNVTAGLSTFLSKIA